MPQLERLALLRESLHTLARSQLDCARHLRPHLAVDVVIADDGVDIELGYIAFDYPYAAMLVGRVELIGGGVGLFFPLSPAKQTRALDARAPLTRPRLRQTAEVT